MKKLVSAAFFLLLAAVLSADPSLETVHEAFSREVSQNNDLLTQRDKALIDVVSLGISRGPELLEERIVRALDEDSVSASELYEALMHLAPYAGIASADEALSVLDDVLSARGIVLEANDERFSRERRFSQGLEAQVLVAGEGMRAAAGLDPLPRISEYLITNCFGDYYTRPALDIQTREMLTLAILVNTGMEGVIRGHIGGNLRMGRSADFIQQVILQCLPYAGYAKILLANACLASAVREGR